MVSKSVSPFTSRYQGGEPFTDGARPAPPAVINGAIVVSSLAAAAGETRKSSSFR
jgi:hypothetical protein